MRNDWSAPFGSSLGPATRGLLVAVGVVGILGALSAQGSGSAFALLACVHDRVLHGELWRLVTASLLTAPQLTHLLFTLLGFYIFSPSIEYRWGTRRFVTFLVQVSVLAFGFETLVSALLPRFGSGVNYGPGLLLSALTVAWGRENPRAEIRLFFVLPVKGSAMVWVTVGFALLGLVYPGDVPEGSLGILVASMLGVALAGSPSPLRRAWLHLKLRWLGARGKRVAIPDAPRPIKRNVTHLRAIPGGRDHEDDDDAKRGPGGRWLN
jgi:membrane associated rhomboid family serine protease